MKRLAAFLIALGCGATAASAQTIPVALGGQRTSIVGLPFAVPITVDMSARSDKVGAFAMRLTWNPAVLQFKSGSDGSFGAITANADSAQAGVLRLTGVNPAGVGGLITLGVGTFVPLTADTTTFSLQLTELYAAATFADLLPSAAVGGTAVYCPARGRYGDINADGNVNSADALIALTNAVGLPTGGYDVTLGDLNASGTTTAVDALIMLSSAVGLDVSAYRVFQVAGGSCAAFANLTMAVAPGSFTMLIGQQARLEARAADSTGALQSLSDLVWKSSNAAVVGVMTDGTAVARGTGTATIVAVHGTDSAATLIHVDSVRTVHVVDAHAVSADVQLGSAAWPFATIAQALLLARAGDTIEVKPGTYAEPVTLDRDVRLIGDTLPDGSRPVIVNTVGDGIHLVNAGQREVRNFAFGTVNSAVNVDGPQSVVLSGLVGQGLPTGILISRATPVVRLLNSRLGGTGTYICCSSYGIDAEYGAVDSLIVVGSDLSDFYGAAIKAPYGGTLVVRGSRIHDMGGYGLYLGGNGPLTSFDIDSSYVARTGYEMFYVQDLAAGRIAHSVLENVGDPYGEVIYQYQENVPAGGSLVLLGDSIATDQYQWLYANDLDSVVVDSVHADIPNADGYLYTIGYIRVSHSRFTNVSSTAFNASATAGVMDVHDVSFTGDPRYDLSGYAIDAYQTRISVDSSTFFNVSEGVYLDGDSGLSVRASSFQHVGYPIEWYGQWYAGCTGICVLPSVGATVRGNTFNGYYTAVDVEGGTLAVDSNTFIGSGEDAIYLNYGPSMSVTHNVLSNDAWAIEVDQSDTSFTAYITDNVMTGVTAHAIYASASSAPDSVHGRFEILRNQVGCTPNGGGISVYNADALVQNNQVLGCQSGVYLQANTLTPRADSVIGNAVQTPVGGYDNAGIVALYDLRSWIVGNAVTADTAGSVYYGPIYVSGSGYPGGTATLIDSNTVNGGLYYGVSVWDIDSAVVTRNTLQGVNNNYYGYGAINAGGTIGSRLAIRGNTVRHPAGPGITALNYASGPDTVVLDSNMVSGANGDGIYVAYSPAVITRNTLTGNARGMHVAYGLTPAIDSNNIAGNAFGLLADGPGVVAQDNWWGDIAGPRCQDTTCAVTSTGDSVSTSYLVAWQPPLGGQVGSAPPPSAPRIFAAARLAPRMMSLRALPAADVMPAAPASRRPHLVAVRPAAAVRAAPTGVAGAGLQWAQGEAAARAALVARMSARATQQAASATARTTHLTQRLQGSPRHQAPPAPPAPPTAVIRETRP